jgi:hypothetical protein
VVQVTVVLDAPRGRRVTDEQGAPPEPARGERRFQLQGATPSRMGIRFSPVLPFNDWLDVGRRVGTHADASLWWLGDWLVYGKYKYGRQYKRGIALTGLDYQTLRNYAAVARRFEMSRRRDKLSFQHHAEVCALSDEEQDRWLDRAEEGRWSRNELRRRLRSELDRELPLTSRALKLAVDAEREARWREAAARNDSEFETWIVSTLDYAASTLLPDD